MRKVLSLAFVVFAAPSVSLAQDNPFKNAKVGDSASYKISTSGTGRDTSVMITQTVKAKDEKEVTVETTGQVFSGVKSVTQKINLAKPLDVLGIMFFTDLHRMTFEVTGNGAEKIKIGNKNYDCKWISGKTSPMGIKIESEVKLWFSDAAPLSGLVKMETKYSNSTTQTRELADPPPAEPVTRENPFKNVKVGDYANYKVTRSVGGKDVTASLKHIVKAKGEKEVTLEATTTSASGKETTQLHSIDLTKPLDINAMIGLDKEKAQDVTFKTGKEKIKIGDKTHDCDWTAGKSEIEDREVKVWMSSTAPLSGLVKIELKATEGGVNATLTMELTDSGSK